MNRERFNDELMKKLDKLPLAERERTIYYFNEMIDDRVEDGMTEYEAIMALGSIDEIVGMISAELPLFERVKWRWLPNRKLTGLEKLLMGITFPIWVPLLLLGISMVFSLYLMLFLLGASGFLLAGSLLAGGAWSIIGGAFLIFRALYSGIFSIGIGLMLLGASLLLAPIMWNFYQGYRVPKRLPRLLIYRR